MGRVITVHYLWKTLTNRRLDLRINVVGTLIIDNHISIVRSTIAPIKKLEHIYLLTENPLSTLLIFQNHGPISLTSAMNETILHSPSSLTRLSSQSLSSSIIEAKEERIQQSRHGSFLLFPTFPTFPARVSIPSPVAVSRSAREPEGEIPRHGVEKLPRDRCPSSRRRESKLRVSETCVSARFTRDSKVILGGSIGSGVLERAGTLFPEVSSNSTTIPDGKLRDRNADGFRAFPLHVSRIVTGAKRLLSTSHDFLFLRSLPDSHGSFFFGVVGFALSFFNRSLYSRCIERDTNRCNFRTRTILIVYTRRKLVALLDDCCAPRRHRTGYATAHTLSLFRVSIFLSCPSFRRVLPFRQWDEKMAEPSSMAEGRGPCLINATPFDFHVRHLEKNFYAFQIS